MFVSIVSVRSLLYEFLFWAGFDSPASLVGWCPPFLASKSGGPCTHHTVRWPIRDMESYSFY